MGFENVSAFKTSLYLKRSVYAINWRIPNYRETT